MKTHLIRRKVTKNLTPLRSALFGFAAVVSALISGTSWAHNHGEAPVQSIADIVIENSGGFDNNTQDYDILFEAVVQADLAGPLGDLSTELTVFAPNDGAFMRLAADLGYSGNSEAEAFSRIAEILATLDPNNNPIPLLTNVLLYHVSPGSQDLQTIVHSTEVNTLLDGSEIVPNGLSLVDKDPDLKNPKLVVSASNIYAANGIIHTLDRVLLPADLPSSTGHGEAKGTQTITDIVAASGTYDNNPYDFDILLQAVLTAGLEGALADPNANLTVFAPTDHAFVSLARDLGYAGHDEEESFNFISEALAGLGDPLTLLTDILLYHVSPEAKNLGDILRTHKIETLLNGGVTFRVFGIQLIDNDPGLKNPYLALGVGRNINADNGMIQPITGVLLPINVTGQEQPKYSFFDFFFSLFR